MATSISCYMGIALAATVLIFPESINHVYLVKISEQLERLKMLADLQDEVVTSPPANCTTGTPLFERAKKERATIVAAQREGGCLCPTYVQVTTRCLAVETLVGFIGLEFSWGRWSGGDVQSLNAPLLEVIYRTGKCLRSWVPLPCSHSYVRIKLVSRDSRIL